MTSEEYQEQYSPENAAKIALPKPPEEIRDAEKLVFISYSTKNPFDANLVCSALENAGIRCWIAPRDLLAGTRFADNIERALSNIKMSVLILSEESASSPWVESEINTAFSASKPILVYRIDGVALCGSLRIMLSMSPALQKTGNSKKDRAAIVENVQKMLKGEAVDIKPLRTPRPQTPKVEPQKVSPTPEIPVEKSSSDFKFLIAGTFLTFLAAIVFVANAIDWERVFSGEKTVPAEEQLEDFGSLGNQENAVPAEDENSVSAKEVEIVVPEKMKAKSVPAKNKEKSVPARRNKENYFPSKTVPDMVEIPGGKLSATVSVSPFKISKTEITQAQWKHVMGAGTKKSKFHGNGDLPVDNVTLSEAVAFCQKLTKMERNAGRLNAREKYELPRKEQWQFACRGEENKFFHSGNSQADLARVAWYKGNSGNKTHLVASKEPNAFGLYDMHGNVCELLSNNSVVGGSWKSAWQACKAGTVQKNANFAGEVGFRVVILSVPLQKSGKPSVTPKTNNDIWKEVFPEGIFYGVMSKKPLKNYDKLEPADFVLIYRIGEKLSIDRKSQVSQFKTLGMLAKAFPRKKIVPVADASSFIDVGIDEFHPNYKHRFLVTNKHRFSSSIILLDPNGNVLYESEDPNLENSYENLKTFIEKFIEGLKK